MAMAAHVEGQILPALPVHALAPLPIHPAAAMSSSESFEPGPPRDLVRSASFTYLPALETEHSDSSTIKRTFSEHIISLPSDPKVKVNESTHSANLELFRRVSRKAKRKMLASARFSLSPDDDEPQLREPSTTNADKDGQPRSLSRSVAGTLRTIARKSWAASSRSSSPARQGDRTPERKRSWSPSKRKLIIAANSVAIPEPAASSPPLRTSPDESESLLENAIQTPTGDRRAPTPTPVQRPLSVIQTRNKSDLNLKRMSRNSSATSLRSFMSNERSQSRLSLNKVPPLPSSLSSDRLAALSAEAPRRKDPLWTAFRTLDGEYSGFQAKTSLQKAKVLRLTLIPFLVKYEHNPSHKSLRAEDLDRRVVILNKWWTGLLEMLHGANNQSISGTDRPAFLESATRIMVRPEWRIPGFASIPGESPQRHSIPKSKSTNSLESEEADFLVDSVHQNVRNIFVQNLLSQMEFVTGILSLRTAPQSLVTFAGKACAYAFFFCPGVADMLVRLWCLPSSALRRLFRQFGVENGEKLDLISNALARNFPPPVRSLCVGSQASFSRRLQQRGPTPPGSERINWFQPWVTRWSGHNSDLFFVFTKQYHLLVSEFLTEEIPLKDRASIPGLVPVCAQMLVILETTIYRQAGQFGIESYAPGTGSHMDNPDALAPMPMTIANATRSIAENRLIMLLRDVMGDLDPEHSLLRNLFLTSFDSVTKAATVKISLYNNDACFVICDFMEEVLPIMFRYHQTYIDTPVLDWPFWLDVCKQMLQSLTTLTQIRSIAFLYSTWSILIHNEGRKRQLVLEWLLDGNIFEKLFCHWSPMVRHYFYRLLCWRVARYDGQVSDLDLEILETLAARLNKCWANYQYLIAEAEMRGVIPPSSAPCSPAPSRVLVIIRTDSQPIMTPSKTHFERYLPASIVTQSSPYQNHSSVLSTIPAADSPAQGNRKRWSLFRGLNVFGSPGNNRPGEVTPPGSPDDSGVSTSGDGPGPNSAITAQKRPTTPPHQAFSFKFSLEFLQGRTNLENKNRMLGAPQLPPNAQSILMARRSSESGGSSSSGNSSDGGSSSSSRSGGSAGSANSNDTRARGRVAEVKPLKPKEHEMGTARYSGRSLAEWAQVLNECRSFYSRRKQEGVPRDSLVETPTMGVENFRLMGG
ncbi:uncharacterized protein Z519_05064 [Cladophialophora bantiana CBS 173.52]|uniref:DUF1765-domain-containing protein n=1 Tax=Cladophialophora bantiana (strain ATCC 10958 / CBS 173.52 / CDC B-1940 / NIH 8579) TaxID=1442370 RepID=A0A0D2IAC3_CLAB1|nr:uncharacterized protein Z519_05064 [Cladophialophora bantiana CBS 173.52]KIW93749.1 hypothetical protein Z519_05064 [Cladophialophora bantiana CBS 173.52]